MTLAQEFRAWRILANAGGSLLGLALALVVWTTLSVPETWRLAPLGLLVLGALAGSLLVDVLQKCPRCGARLIRSEQSAVGERRRWMWLARNPVGDRCRGCGLDLNETRRADFATPEARAAWEARNEARKAEARRGRTFG